jgi:hypothetical protein
MPAGTSSISAPTVDAVVTAALQLFAKCAAAPLPCTRYNYCRYWRCVAVIQKSYTGQSNWTLNAHTVDDDLCIADVITLHNRVLLCLHV